jgi:endonuclease/exonuclease/phosphatase family metal-dependent hydrolase
MNLLFFFKKNRKIILFLTFFILLLIFLTPFIILLIDNFYAQQNTHLKLIDQDSTSIRVFTFNIHQFWPQQESEIYAFKFLDLFLSLDADIIGLQEAFGASNGSFSFDVSWFASQLNMSYYQAPGSSSSSFHGLAILSRFPLANENFSILKHSDTIFSRVLIWVTVLTPSGNFTVFNTHLDTLPNQANQINQTNAILDIADDYSLALLLGDFNTPDFFFIEPYRILAESFDDVWVASKNTFEGRTWPSDHPFIRVDYIFVQGVGWKVVKDSTQLIGDSSFSDHLGVLTGLVLS